MKKLIAFALVIILTFSMLAACSGNEDSNTLKIAGMTVDKNISSQSGSDKAVFFNFNEIEYNSDLANMVITDDGGLWAWNKNNLNPIRIMNDVISICSSSNMQGLGR